MLHTALALVELPGARWLREQVKRVRSLNDGGCLDCTGDVKLWTIASEEVDTTSELEYEFVRYYDDIKIVLIAIIVGDGDRGAPIRFARKLFPRVPHGEHTLMIVHFSSYLSTPKPHQFARACLCLRVMMHMTITASMPQRHTSRDCSGLHNLS